MGKVQDPKRCPSCDTYKPRSEFRLRTGFTTAVASWCKECSKKSCKKWYAENREASINYSAEWRKNNPELYREQMRKWRTENPQRKNELEHRRRTRKQDNGVYAISPRDMRYLAGSCVYCGSLENITMDHVIPISRGGTHGIGNLVPCCLSCNTKKNDKTVMEWKLGKLRPQRT